MILTAPCYYPAFRCIADRCRHSCCIGWEIGIDPESRETYRAMTDDFGARLNGCIEDSANGAAFRLLPGDRCPLLNESGLCDLILQKGEGALCQICADHPRYRSFFSHMTEIGLGLCCEEAARIILSRTEKTFFITLEDDGVAQEPDEEEAALLALRAECISIMQQREFSVDVRLELLLDHVDACWPLGMDPAWVAFYRDLERLDPAWDGALDTLGGEWDELPHLTTAFEQFAVYLLYRHLPGDLADGDARSRVKFAALNTRLLMALCCAHAKRHGACTLEDCAEYARMWSAEIEYDEDNVDALLDALWEEEYNGDPGSIS